MENERETKKVGDGPSPDFRLALQEELLRRIRKNSKYSLRSFANLLKVNPGTLSQILNGKRVLSDNAKESLLKKLGFDPQKIYELSKQPQSESSFKHFNQLTLDAFQVIADWYHYAILELTQIKSFVPDKKWIAMTLNLSTNEVTAAVERLIRLKYLEITRDNQWIDRSGDITTVGNDFTHIAFRKLQRQVLEQALTALEEVSYEKRDHSSITCAVNSKDLEEIKKRIKRFRRDLVSFIERNEVRDQVCQLAIAFFPITRGV